jgi:hypothetical protein
VLSGRNSSERSLPSALAAYMATSALRSSSSASSAPGSPVATPRLASIGMVRPLRPNGWCRVSSTGPATAAASAVTRSSSTANSSPPRRAAVSVGRRQPWSRRAAAISSWSPAAWPRLSLTCLKSSRSMNSTASSTRSANRVRLARPVSPSWKAWWTSLASSFLRSETSRVFSTRPRRWGPRAGWRRPSPSAARCRRGGACAMSTTSRMLRPTAPSSARRSDSSGSCFGRSRARMSLRVCWPSSGTGVARGAR